MADLLRAVAGSSSLLGQDILPTVTVFVIFMVLMARYGKGARRTARVSGSADPPPLAGVIRRLGSTVAGGYVVFAVLVVVFYTIGGQSLRYILDALGAGAILAFGVVGPVFGFAIWLQRRNRPAS